MCFSFRYALLMCALFTPVSGLADRPDMDPDLRKKAERAVDTGLHYLRGTQAQDGSYSHSVGVTAIALRAYLESYRGYSEADGAFITRPVRFILDHVKEDGSISDTNQNRNYNTAVAMIALKATANPKYAQILRDAQRFLERLQLNDDDGYVSMGKYCSTTRWNSSGLFTRLTWARKCLAP